MNKEFVTGTIVENYISVMMQDITIIRNVYDDGTPTCILIVEKIDKAIDAVLDMRKKIIEG